MKENKLKSLIGFTIEDEEKKGIMATNSREEYSYVSRGEDFFTAESDTCCVYLFKTEEAAKKQLAIFEKDYKNIIPNYIFVIKEVFIEK